MSKIRVAVVGAGGIGGTHLQAYVALADRCEIVGIADAHLPAAAEKVAKFGGRAFQDFGEMLDGVKPEAISICTPPNLHLPVVQAAAQRNIHVLCEKPPARTLAETQTLVDVMAASRGILQFAFCHVFHQPVKQAQALITSGKLGRVVQIDNRFAFRFGRLGHSWHNDLEVAGGGVLIDTLVHSVYIFRALAGEIVAVNGSISTTFPGSPVDDSASLLVTSASGAIGTLTASWVTPIPVWAIRIDGSEGQAVIDYGQSGGLRYRLADDQEWTELPFDEPDRFQQQAAHFLDCIASGQQPLIGVQDGLAVMKVIDEAYRSARVLAA